MSKQKDWVMDELDAVASCEAEVRGVEAEGQKGPLREEVDVREIEKDAERLMAVMPWVIREMLERMGPRGEWERDEVLGCGVWIYIVGRGLGRDGEVREQGEVGEIEVRGLGEVLGAEGRSVEVDAWAMGRGIERGAEFCGRIPMVDMDMLAGALIAHAGVLIRHWREWENKGEEE